MVTLSNLQGEVVKEATFSNEVDPTYRYYLERGWDYTKPPLVWVMLNPSTADHWRDDPTIRACMSFARALDCGSISVVNLFALRSPHPKALLAAEDPVGPENDAWLEKILLKAAKNGGNVVAAWGANGSLLGREAQMNALAEKLGVPLLCYGLTKAGHPKHPLARGVHRIPKSQSPQSFPA